ncbi:MAG TPA: SpoIIE family protein phosphatase [Tepidisphaeraceae bacterium]
MASDAAWLISLPGSPGSLKLQLQPVEGRGLLLGRAKDCDLRLPAEIEEVSRHHARFLNQSCQWSVVDLGSRWGTQVNGVKIPPNCPLPIASGDQINIHPWSFRFTIGSDSLSTTTTVNDTGGTIICNSSIQSGLTLKQDMLNMLLEGSKAIGAAENLKSLAATLASIACRAGGFDAAAVVRTVDAEGGIEVLALEIAPPNPPMPMRFSRTLLNAASNGDVTEYSAGGDANASETIIQSNVASAICVALLVGSAVHSYLYVQAANASHPHAASFCQTLARLGGLAIANLQRIEIERSVARMRAELSIASAAQRFLLPKTPISAGPFICHGKSIAGDGYLGGDFFDIQILPCGRLAVSLGDVSGHGAPASILMAVAQGFLRAALADHGDLARAAAGLNQFTADHSHRAQYMTLWLGILNPIDMTLTYINAGHGHAYLIKPNDEWKVLDENGELPIGLGSDTLYVPTTLPLAQHERLLIISDGIMDQPNSEIGPGDMKVRFGFEGVRAALGRSQADGVIDHLFNAVRQFAASTDLVDDLTALLVEWP